EEVIEEDAEVAEVIQLALEAADGSARRAGRVIGSMDLLGGERRDQPALRRTDQERVQRPGKTSDTSRTRGIGESQGVLFALKDGETGFTVVGRSDRIASLIQDRGQENAAHRQLAEPGIRSQTGRQVAMSINDEVAIPTRLPCRGYRNPKM